MNLLSLNHDVLTMVLSYVAPGDAVNFAETCSSAYTISLPRFLSEITIGGAKCPVGDGPKHVSGFCAFMLADIPNRMPYLRILDLSRRALLVNDPEKGYMYDMSCVSLLAEMLQHALRLKKISFVDRDDLLVSHSHFRDAVASLRSLNHIHLQIIGQPTMSLLSQLTCRPRTLVLQTEFMRPWHDDASGRMGFPRNLIESVEELHLKGCVEFVESHQLRSVWPSVRVLKLIGPVRNLSAFASAFPNVHSVTLFHVEIGSPVRWPHLRHAVLQQPFYDTGDMTSPLAHKLHHLELQYPTDSLIADRSTASLLEKTSPVVLTFGVDPAFIALFRQIADTTPRLKFLRLFAPRKGEGHAWLVSAVQILGALSLNAVTFFNAHVFDLHRQERAKFARDVAASVPALQYVGCGGITFPFTTRIWYKVTSRDDEGLPQLEEVPLWEALDLEQRLLGMPRS